MSGTIEVIVIVAAVGYVLIRRMIGEPAEAKRMLVIPAILTVIGLMDVVNAAQTPTSLAFLVATMGITVAIALLRGLTIRLFPKNGLVYMRYTALTIVLLVLNLAIKIAANLLLTHLMPSAEQGPGSELVLSLGVGTLVEGAIVLLKAMRVEGQILWSKGKKGRPHTTSQFVDELQQRVQRGSTTAREARDETLFVQEERPPLPGRSSAQGPSLRFTPQRRIGARRARRRYRFDD